MEFSEEDIEYLKKYQDNGRFHPYTCCSYNGCVRSDVNNWGTLIPTNNKWVCPCGKYTQDYSDSEEKSIEITKLHEI